MKYSTLPALNRGTAMIPRARLDKEPVNDEARQNYLRRVHAEHESLLDAIVNQDPEAARAAARTHLANSRERWRRAAAPAAGSAGGQPATA